MDLCVIILFDIYTLPTCEIQLINAISFDHSNSALGFFRNQVTKSTAKSTATNGMIQLNSTKNVT